MRDIIICLALIAMVLPVTASPGTGQAGASAAKGARGVPVASATESTPASDPTAAPMPVKEPKSNSQPWIVITPRLPDLHDMHHNGPATVINSDNSAPSDTATGRLARVTAYWPSEGDYYTRHSVAATGVRLHDGHCAVDPNIIPYGSVVDIAGVGKFLAVDTGTAVIERTAARAGGHTKAERNALVIDLFFENRRAGEAFASSAGEVGRGQLVDAELDRVAGEAGAQPFRRGRLAEDPEQAALRKVEV